jgi:hypothetical protein
VVNLQSLRDFSPSKLIGHPVRWPLAAVNTDLAVAPCNSSLPFVASRDLIDCYLRDQPLENLRCVVQ